MLDGVNAFHQMPLDESKACMISFIYTRKAFFAVSIVQKSLQRAPDIIIMIRCSEVKAGSACSGMTDGSGMTHRKCRGAHVRLMPTVWAHYSILG